MERYVAVDNVCAWPNLTLMPDGTIVGTIFNQPAHGAWEGDVACWASTDGGCLWELRGIPAPHEPGTNRMNVAAGLARNGDLLVLCSGWTDRLPPGEPRGFGAAKVLPPWVCRSGDGGRTWSRNGSMGTTLEGVCTLIPFGDVIQLAGGSLGVSGYAKKPSGGHGAYFYRSDDDGQTWSCVAEIADGINETALLALPDGRLLAAARTFADQYLRLYISADKGVTWNAGGALTLGMQHPAHLLLLADSRLLLVFGIRNEGLYGVGARFSSDTGRTWSPPRILVDFQTATDGGYPSSVQLPDGTVVTAYYCNRTPAHQRYHMGVLRWQSKS